MLLPGLVSSAGFIANRRELAEAAELPPGASDADLAARLFARSPLDTARSLTGTFACVIRDPARGRQLLVRDRMGSQGVYHAHGPDGVRAAFSVADLLAAGDLSRRVCERAVVAHLDGEAPPPAETFYEEIRAVEPGSIVEATPDGARTERYWQPSLGPLLRLADDRDYAAAYRALLERVATDYLTSARCGVTLSGGLDSTSVAWALRAAGPAAEIRAYCDVAPELPDADESASSAEVAARLGMPVESIRADLAWPLAGGAGAGTSVDGPFRLAYDAKWDSLFGLARRQGVGLLFGGIGGDELFGGDLFEYADLALSGRWRRLGRHLRAHLAGLPEAPGRSAAWRHLVAGPLARRLEPARWARRRAARGLPAWLAPRHRDLMIELRRSRELPREGSPGRWARLALVGDAKVPRASAHYTALAARHGVDFRHPLLDHRLVEFALSLPSDQAVRAGWRKLIVRNAMRGSLPGEVVDRRRKVVPTPIAERGLRERETGRVWEYLTDMRAASMGYVDEPLLRQAYQDYLDRRTNDARFWHAVTLEDWLRRHF